MKKLRPYYRIYRENCHCRNNKYLLDELYSKDRNLLLRAFYMIQEDLKKTFEYIEPHSDNFSVYSHRLYELILRICTEVENNFKGMLRDNGYDCSKNLNIKDYYKIEKATHISKYELKIKLSDQEEVIKPFKEWSKGHSLNWYSSYNKAKHDRTLHFKEANLKNVLIALAGLQAVLYSQFGVNIFSLYGTVSSVLVNDDGSITSDNENIFSIKTNVSWNDSQKYNFDWNKLKTTDKPLEKYDF